MSKWKQEVNEYFSKGLEIHFIMEDENVLVYRWNGDIIKSGYLGITIKKLNKSFAIMLSVKHFWERTCFTSRGTPNHSWGMTNSFKEIDFLGEDLKYLKDAIFLLQI